MSKVSIIIPVRGEQYQVSPGVTVLQRTVQDILEKAVGDIEIIVAFDGPPYQALRYRDNIRQLNMEWKGTKHAVNAAVKEASGDYILKTDAHCMFDHGFDEKLQVNMQDNWVVMPRMYILDAEHWKWQDDRFYDYFRLPCPFTYKRGFLFQAGGHWPERTKERLRIDPDENMKLHGSCWFMAKKHFTDRLGGLDPNNGSGSWNGEDIEITMKTWLGPWDGKLMVCKDTWFAHMHRGGQRPREYGFSMHEAYESAMWTADYWMGNSWVDRVHDVEWLIDKFWPIPGWPDNWRELLETWKLNKHDPKLYR